MNGFPNPADAVVEMEAAGGAAAAAGGGLTGPGGLLFAHHQPHGEGGHGPEPDLAN